MIQVIILAAGKGTRMKSESPKVLHQVNGRSMIARLMDSVKSSVAEKPLIIVSPENQSAIKDELSGLGCEFAVQEQQLGTGHAVGCALDHIDDECDKIIVLNGDNPFIKATSIDKLAGNPDKLSMLTVEISDFEDWRQAFYQWGRVVREDGRVRAIVEFKDASDEIIKIKEVNAAAYCFDRHWLEENIKKLNNSNSQKEFYLTDLINLAFADGINIFATAISAEEAFGINSKLDLEVAEGLIKE